MAVICNDIAINNDNIEFGTEYFLHALNVLNRKQKISPDELRGFANNLKSSGNNVLMYIGECIIWDLAGVAGVARGAAPRPPNEISVGLKEHFIKDIHHDFSVEPTRCYPKIIRCLQGPTHPYHSIDAYASFQAIKGSYNIHDMSTYNLKAEYFMEDTNSTVIKNKLNMSEKPIKKMNLIANILDSAGCKYCCEDHHYNTIDLEIELYILNIGFIFYQSYFKQLRDNGIHIHFTISLMDEKETKKSFSENKMFKLCLYSTRDGAEFKEKEFVLSNNRNFSVPNVCKTLNSKVLRGLSKELKDYLEKELTIGDVISNKILTTTYVSGKGFGDFGQVFSVACLYYCCLYFQGNCILTTIDTFLFIIAIILGCPIIIGTGRFSYISIDDFLKYKGKTIIEAHNMYSNPQIFLDGSSNSSPTAPDITKIMSSLNGEIKSIVPNFADISGRDKMSVGMAQIPRYNPQEEQQPSSDVSMSQKSKSSKSKSTARARARATARATAKPKDELTLTPIQASFLFNVFTKLSLQYFYELNKLIYISCTSNEAQSNYVLKEKSSNGREWIQLLKYDTYFDNKLFSERYEDKPEGRALLKTVSSHTLYTQYCNFKNFIDYILHNYDINAVGTFLEHILDSLKKGIKTITPEVTKNNIFFVLNILLDTAQSVKDVNAKFYEQLKDQVFLDDMKGAMSTPKSQDKVFLAFKAEVLSKWNIGLGCSMLDRLRATSLLKEIKEVSEFITSCDPRYNVAYTFIGDIQTVIKNLEKIVNIIMTTIGDIKIDKDTLENLRTFINLFNLYKRYLLANCFNIQVEKLKSIIDDDIIKLNAIISESWKVCDCQGAFEKRFKEQEGEQEQGSKKIKMDALAEQKNYFFKDSAIASKTLDEADKIYRKMGKLLLPNVSSMKDHPIAESFWCCLTAFKDLNCKFASLKSYSEQYLILKNNIEIIELTMAQLLPLLTPDTPDVLEKTPQVLVYAEQWFGSIHKVFQDINDGIVAMAQEQAMAQERQQAMVQQQQATALQRQATVQQRQDMKQILEGSKSKRKFAVVGGDINSIINKIIKGDKIAEQYSDNISIGDGCSTVQCDNMCDSMNYDCRQSGNCSESAGPGASRRPPPPPQPPQQASMRASMQASQRQSQRPSQGTSLRPPQGISQGTSLRPPQGISQGTSLRPPQRASQRPPQGTSQQESQRPLRGISQRPSQGTSRQKPQRQTSRRGGAIKLKENKKIILGKERCIYTKEGTKKEYIKYKNEYIGLKEFIKFKSIEKKSKTTKKTQAEPKATKATTKKTQAEPKATKATTKKTQTEPKATTTNTKNNNKKISSSKK